MKISDELFAEVGGKGSVAHALAKFSDRYDDLIVQFSESPDIDFSKIADIGRALKKRHLGKTIIPQACVRRSSASADQLTPPRQVVRDEM